MHVQPEAAAAQAFVHVLGQHAEVLLGRRIVRVVVGEPVVLVGDQVELAARGAAEGQPGVADWGLAVLVDGELEDALGHGVVQQREDARDGGRVEVRRHQIEEELRHVCGGLDHLVQRVRVVDRPAQREGTARVERHEAAGREDADDACHLRPRPAGG